MFINEDLDYLYRKLDYAIWQKESAKDAFSIQHKKAQKLISFYKRKILSLQRQNKEFKQLVMF